MRILLVRHGQSEGNIDYTVYRNKPDHAISLTEEGISQAKAAGEFLKEYLSDTVKFRVWNSPYLRARQTKDTLLSAIGRSCQVSERENVALVERDLGLFNGYFQIVDGHLIPDSYCQREFPLQYDHYMRCVAHQGSFWARIPLGESGLDVVNRIQGAFGPIHHDFEKHGIDTVVVVAHALVIKAFIMSWCRLPYEWMQESPQPANASIHLIDDSAYKGIVYEGFPLGGKVSVNTEP